MAICVCTVAVLQASRLENADPTQFNWSDERDAVLIAAVGRFKSSRGIVWQQVEEAVRSRVGHVAAGVCQKLKDACKYRWNHFLRPGLCGGKATDDDLKLIARLHEQYGTQFGVIGMQMTPIRSGSWVANHFNRSKNEALKEARCALLCPSYFLSPPL